MNGRNNGHTLRFGLVGAGAIAQAYAQASDGCERIRIVAVADIRAEAAAAMAEGLRCRAFDSYEAMANKTKMEAVLVCTPPSTHYEICMFFLQRGIHVLCEKPLTLDSASAVRMSDAALHSGVTLTMGSKFRYVEDVIRAKSIVTSGLLGEIILFENSFTSRVDMSARWNSDPRISGGGVLIDNGSHSVDLVRYFLGPLSKLQVVEGKRVQGLPVEDTVRIFVRSVSGVMGSIDLSWSIHKEQEHYISIYGSRGTVFVGWKESKYRPSSSRDWIVFGKGYDKVQAFRSQLSNFAGSIRGEEPLIITAEDAVASVRAIEASYAALRRSRWTSVKHLAQRMSRSKLNGQVKAAATEVVL